MNLRKAAIRLAYEHPELRPQLLPILGAQKKASRYPKPGEVASAAKKVASACLKLENAIYDLRGKKGFGDLGRMLQNAKEDATGSGVSFQDVPDKTVQELIKVRDQRRDVDSKLMDTANSLGALARDLKKLSANLKK